MINWRCRGICHKELRNTTKTPSKDLLARYTTASKQSGVYSQINHEWRVYASLRFQIINIFQSIFVFWGVKPRGCTDKHRRKLLPSSSRLNWSTHKSTRRNNPADENQNFHRRENLKSNFIWLKHKHLHGMKTQPFNKYSENTSGYTRLPKHLTLHCSL
jgi:hypothetical protein